MKTQPIPQGVSMMTPHLVVKDAAKAIDFYKNVFCADEMYRLMTPDGKKVMHACLNLCGQTIFVADVMKGTKAPGKSGSYLSMHLYVGDVDKVHKRAIKNGATEVTKPENAFWGDRFSKVLDPMGIHWALATHIEDVSPEEMSKRAEDMMKAEKKKAEKKSKKK
jgi:PhnB protein